MTRIERRKNKRRKNKIFFSLYLTEEQTVSKWENGCSVPDSSMLISLADELDTSVSILLGENVSESPADDLKLISEKLEMINSKLAKKSIMKLRMLRGRLITLCILIIITFIVLTVMHSSYLGWNFNNPEIAVAGTILHGFEFFFCKFRSSMIIDPA